MRYINTTQNAYDQELANAAEKGLMHYAECQEGQTLRKFFRTRSEAVVYAERQSTLEEDVGNGETMSWLWEPRSLGRDEYGSLMTTEETDEEAE